MNEYKQQLQDQAFSTLKGEKRVVLKWATGCGKSKMTIDLLKHNLCSLPHGSQRVLFVVAERAHRKNWQEEFEKWKLNIAPYCITMVCYNSLHKVNTTYYDAIVLDEAHHAFTEKRLAALNELKDNLMPGAYIYLLSATLSSSKLDIIEDIFGKFTVSSVTLKDAIRNEILPDPKVYIIGMELDNTFCKEKIQIGTDPNAPKVKWEDRAKYIYRKEPCVIKCTEFQKNLHITSMMDYWKQRYERSHNEFQKNLWVNLGSQRKRFLGELKTKYVFQLINSLPKNNRYVCFCASVAQADLLSEHNTISSKRTAKRNQHIIDAFNSKAIDNIYAVGMITEGMNLKDIQTGIIVQLDGKERLFVQKIGRALRADSPVVFLFYYKGTQDEVYLQRALENIDEKYIRRLNINQLNSIRL